MNNRTKRRTAAFRKANPVKLSGYVADIAQSLGIAPGVHLDELKRGWPDIVGATNARQTEPVSLDNGILTVLVKAPSWITQLRLQKASFLSTIASCDIPVVSELTDVRFVLAGNNRSRQ